MRSVGAADSQPPLLAFVFLNPPFNTGYEVTVVRLIRQLQRGLPVGNRLLMQTDARLGLAPKVMGIGFVGLQTDGLIKVGYGPPISTKHELSNAPTVLDVGVIGLQLESLIKVGYRLLVLTKSNSGITATDVGGSVFGPYADGLTKVGNSTLIFVVLEPGNAPFVVVV